MKLKYKVRQTSVGKWAVWKDKTHYFINEQYDNETDAIEASVKIEGAKILSRLNEIQIWLEENNRVDESDPLGWRA